MIKGTTKSTFLLLAFLTLSLSASAQSSSGSTNYLLYGLIGVIGLLLLVAILMVAENLLHIEAKQMGVDKSGTNYSIFPNGEEIFKGKSGSLPSGASVTALKRGHDIKLAGEAEKVINADIAGTTFALQPQNFIGISPIPKVTVEKGDEVKAGDPLFFDKKNPSIIYCAPVSGEVMEVRRGEKRSIKEIIILADKEMKHRTYDLPDLATCKREDLVEFLLASGAWPMIRQRPFDMVADFNIIPQNIFISTFDTAPLAPDNSFIVEGQGAAFQKGLDVLNKLAGNKVHLGLSAEGASSVFAGAQGVEINYFSGPHPAGNVGVQMHHTSPIDLKDPAWVLGVQEVLTIGKLFAEGKFDASRVVALTGDELDAPKYVRTYQGANVGELVKGNLKGDNTRLVAGDVLSGKQTSADSFLNFFDDQITALEEGNEFEMFGWLLPLSPRPSVSKTYPNFLFPDLKFKANTNTHGEKRAFVVTGQYEKVMPMDILPQHLMKAILVNDFERMEGLGIYELSEEDVALCEFVCTSKQPLQQILREGLETMREQA